MDVEKLLDNEIGVTKDEVAALVAPIEKGRYTAKFIGLRKQMTEDPDTGEKTFIGYVHPTQKGGKKVVPMFQLVSDDPLVNNRVLSGHVSTTMRLFGQLDKELDLMTGSRIDADKVEEALDKVVTLSVGLDDESIDETTGRVYEAKNTIQGVFKYRE